MWIGLKRGSHRFWAAIAVAALMLAAADPAVAKTVYVDGVNGNDAWDGLCEEWDGGACGPKKTIQAGISVAVNDDEVVVADAVYSGTGNIKIQFFGKKITVRSKNGPDNCIVDILNGSDPGFHFENGEGVGSVLDGFTVRKCSGC
ncbi:MAG: hypothetical protein JSV91_11610 [Phycisphaerales bacterium]|nr:MAG: hypothetical protein JSV91_11610 [Phycisphaerales bacterium]